MLIDSHCHVSPLWYEPVETLLFQMDRVGVERAVLVQLLGQTDNSYQQDCLKRFPERFANVVGVDGRDPRATDELARLADRGAAGVRLRPDAPEPLWRAAEAGGLAVSCVGTAAAFAAPAFATLVGDLADVRVVLEHLGGIARPDVGDADAIAPAIMGLARLPNLYLKLPGLGQLAARAPTFPEAAGRPLPAEASRFIREALAAFGPTRLMWGSDFPPVAAREGYANALAWTREALSERAASDHALVFGDVARAVFFAGT